MGPFSTLAELLVDAKFNRSLETMNVDVVLPTEGPHARFEKSYLLAFADFKRNFSRENVVGLSVIMPREGKFEGPVLRPGETHRLFTGDPELASLYRRSFCVREDRQIPMKSGPIFWLDLGTCRPIDLTDPAGSGV